ncbi:hypothetical protein X798_02725 [Onchocerca flexuosa]|uniref:Uncharacterized protein n=2 Tax=Onchocerca flexuosa TaxID=387005 RepID=A0A183I1Z7_9BILA|nr:hypothetical protein X798_02725 [Onchocerca flexuosa]VDP14583.1 unnamed protein product [Onchocerca flexuosa]
MSTSEEPLELTASICHRQQRRQQQLSSAKELAITTTSSISNSGLLSSSSTPATTTTTRSDTITFQKPFNNFIDVIVAVFTILRSGQCRNDDLERGKM